MHFNGKSYCFVLMLLSNCAFASPDEDFELAVQAFVQADTNTAYIHLKNVLQQAPEHISAKVLMGKILLDKGYFSDAITEFEEALHAGADIASMLDALATAYLFSGKNQQVIDLGSQHTLTSGLQFDWHLLAAAAYLNTGDIEQAEAHYLAASKLQSTSQRLLNSQAALRLKQRRYSEADAIIRQALNQDADNPQTLQLHAEWLQLTGNPQDAQVFYERATQLSPTDPLLRRALLRNYVSQHKLALADATVKHILQYTPEDPYALLLAAWLAAITPDSATSSKPQQQLSELLWQMSREQIEAQPSRLYSRALLSYVDGDYEKARSDLTSYMQLVPADLNAVAILAQVYNRQNDQSAAIQLLEQHIKHLNTMPDLAQQLITLYIRTNKANKAEQLIAALRLQYPDNAEFAILHAAVLKQLSRHTQAQQLVDSYAQQHGSTALISTNQALTALENNDLPQAMRLVEQLLLQAPDNSGYLNFKAAVLIKQQQYAAAKTLLHSILQLDPKYQAAQFNLAQIALTENAIDKAITLLEPIVASKNGYKPAPTLLAAAYIKAGKMTEAETLLRDVSAVTPYPPADELLFDLYLQQHNYEAALLLVNKGLERAFLNETLLWKKAQLLKLLKRNDEASYNTELLSSIVQHDADKLLRLAMLQRELAQYPASERSLLAAHSIKPDAKIIKLELVNHYLLTNTVKQAEHWLQRLKPQATKDANVQMLQGDVALMQGNNQLAIAWYQRALQLDRKFKLVWIKLYQLAKQTTDAANFSQLALDTLQQQSDFSWLRRLLAEHYVNMQQHADAIQQYETLLAAGYFTDDVTLYNNLANLYLPTNAATALIHAETAVRLGPKHAPALDTYGWILSKTGQYQQALAVLRQAHTLDAAAPAARFHLAYTLVQLQRSDEAKIILQQLLADNSAFSEKVAAEQLLQQL